MQHSLTSSSDGVESLKHLRLVSRHFAYAPVLLAVLFQKITLVASPESAKLKGILTTIPYVRHVKFQTSKYSWDMTLDLFREILFYQPIRDLIHAYHNSEPQEGLSNEDERESLEFMTPLDFVSRYMQDNLPFAEDEINTGYKEYMLQAERTRKLFTAGVLTNAWTEILRRMSGGVTVEIGKWEFKCQSPPPNWKERGCVLYPHPHDYHPEVVVHKSSACYAIHGSVGEMLFDTVLECLAGAGTRIKALEIRHCVRSQYYESFTWAENGQLDGLDLSSLQSLCFHAKSARKRKSRIEVIPGAVTGITAILVRVASSLRHLEVLPHKRPNALWPDTPFNDFVPLPHLTSLRTGAAIYTDAFACFLREARNLKHLTIIRSNTLESALCAPWRTVWRAIRHHPSRMVLKITHLLCRAAMMVLYMEHDTAKDSESKHDPDVPGYDLQYSLEMYLSNRGKWNRRCRTIFRKSYEDVDEADDDDGSETDEDEIKWWKGAGGSEKRPEYLFKTY